MSDVEKSNHSENEDDLFNENEEDDLGLGLDGSDNEAGEVQDDVNDNEQDQDEQEDENDEEEHEEVELKTLGISLPRHAVTSNMEKDATTIKMPVFLSVDPHPFDPVEFKETLEINAQSRSKQFQDIKSIHNDSIREKLLNENTLRWRYSNVNDEIIKQSNCHFVEWDDGSISLKVGNEMFDYKELPLFDNLLAKSYDDLEILQGHKVLSKSANLLPSSTFTSTHRQLTNAIKNIQRKDTILNTTTDTDPMETQRLADENEKRALKMRRQLEMKRKLQEERLGRSNAPGGDERDSYEPSYERFNRNYGNEEYDDEDDFIANDEDDDEEEDDDDDEGAERLKNLKKQGASKYQDEEDEEDEEEDEEEEDDEEEEEGDKKEEKESRKAESEPREGSEEDEGRRKRRRIIDSDEDEE